MLDFASSFDTSGSLAAMYLWLMFGYLSVMLNCDLQRMITSSAVIRHLLGLVAFYFLFTVIDPQNNVAVWVTLTKTILVYTLFVLATKSRWYFAGTALLLLLADQMLKNHMAYLDKNTKEDYEKKKETFKKIRKALLVCIIVVIFAGTFDYYVKQMKDKKSSFRISTFLLGKNKCNIK